MKAFFELKEIFQSWTDPLADKRIESKDVMAGINEYFDTTEKGKPMFRLVQMNGDKVLVEYNRDYTLKGYEQPLSRTIWVKVNEPVSFSSLWNSNGITKKLVLKRIGIE